MLKQGRIGELDVILNRAEEFHGHLGPFLVLGVRMGFIGVRETQTKENNRDLHVTAMVRNSVPFSCVIDGIQMATRCTVGNKKLEIRKSLGVAAKFENQNRKVIVRLNPTGLEELRERVPSEDASSEEIRRLAHMVASIPEEELFIIERK